MKSRGKKDDFDIDFFKDFDVEIPAEEPVFPLKIVCSLLDMHYWTIHDILKEGLLKPKKKADRKKMFSHEDIKVLKYIKYLMEDKGVNIKGVKVILEMKGDI